jgi:hypothetical protein
MQSSSKAIIIHLPSLLLFKVLTAFNIVEEGTGEAYQLLYQVATPHSLILYIVY